MAQVKMLRNAAERVGCKLSEGETGDVSDELAAVLVSSGVAELLNPKTIKAVATEPELKGVDETPEPIKAPAETESTVSNKTSKKKY